VRAKSVNSFCSPRAHMQGHLAAKPGLRPPDRPLVLCSQSKSNFVASFPMKVNNTKLLKFLEAIGRNLFGLIMQLIALSEAVAARFPTEA
jgi:hypothetical protein